MYILTKAHLLGAKRIAAAAAQTWDPAKKSASITLSNGNLTALNSGSSYQGALGVAGYTSGKYYCEFTIEGMVQTFSHAVGIGNASYAYGVAGQNLDSIANYNTDTTIYLNNGSIGTNGVFFLSDVVSMAVDFGATLIWFRVNGGNWNAGGGADPASGTGGADFSAWNGGAGYPLVSMLDNGQVTANFGATAYAYSAPSGFGNW